MSMNLRYRSSRDLFSFEASYTEIATDFKEIDCYSPVKPSKALPETCNKKRRCKKSDEKALNGVLGLASLMSDRDIEIKKLPEDWFQPYPLTQISQDRLPTGIPLIHKSLLAESFDIYLESRSNSNTQYL